MAGIRDIWVYANNIIRSARELINEELQELNLSSSEGNILLHLLTQNRYFRQDDLVEQLDISRPAVSRALESLEKKGYITREKEPFDKRVNWVTPTEKAHQIGPVVEEIYSKIFETATQGVTDEEVMAFITMFAKVSESFSAAIEGKRSTKQQ